MTHPPPHYIIFHSLHLIYISPPSHLNNVHLHLMGGYSNTSVQIKLTNHKEYLHLDNCHSFHTKKFHPYNLSTPVAHLLQFITKYTTELTDTITDRPCPDTSLPCLVSPVTYHPTHTVHTTNKPFSNDSGSNESHSPLR